MLIKLSKAKFYDDNLKEIEEEIFDRNKEIKKNMLILKDLYLPFKKLRSSFANFQLKYEMSSIHKNISNSIKKSQEFTDSTKDINKEEILKIIDSKVSKKSYFFYLSLNYDTLFLLKLQAN